MQDARFILSLAKYAATEMAAMAMAATAMTIIAKVIQPTSSEVCSEAARQKREINSNVMSM